MDVIDPCVVRIKHPQACRPYRPEPRPAWSPGRRDRRDAGKPRPLDPPTRHSARLVSAANLGAVRINFRYAAYMSMTAGHSEKAGRDQYFEGPHESYGFRYDEISPKRLDIQYQPIEIRWRSLAGKHRLMTLDFAVETDTNQLIFGEDKASEDYFDDPDLNERLEFAQALLEDHGATFDRRIKGGLKNDMERRVVKRIFNGRRTPFDDATAACVVEHIRSAGGTAPLGSLLPIIGGHSSLSLNIAAAMMHGRLISMPISEQPMADTPVTLPRPATKGALRAFLADFVPAPGDAT